VIGVVQYVDDEDHLPKPRYLTDVGSTTEILECRSAPAKPPAPKREPT